MQVMGEFELDVLAPLLAGARRRRLGGGRARHLARIRREGRLRGTICAWPTDEWARRVFPELEPQKAQRKLAQDLLSFCRLGPKDPPGHKGWTQHLATLRRRATRLTRARPAARCTCTTAAPNLRLKIAPYSMWRGGGEKDHWGRQIAMNVPTEECFISPDAAATEGTFRCSRPRSFGGRVIEELAGEFRSGRLVRLSAKRDGRPRLARPLPGRDPERRAARRDRARRLVVADRPDGPHLLQRPARRERRGAHGLRLGLREDAHRPDRPEALRRQPLEDAHRRDDRHRRPERRRHPPERPRVPLVADGDLADLDWQSRRRYS